MLKAVRPLPEGCFAFIGYFVPSAGHQFGGSLISGIGELGSELAAIGGELAIFSDGSHGNTKRKAVRCRYYFPMWWNRKSLSKDIADCGKKEPTPLEVGAVSPASFGQF
jgi:hypothetical protein